jgi:hypothetical protein
MAPKATPALLVVKTRIDPVDAAALREHAKADGRSIAGQVAFLIRQYLDTKAGE